MVAEEEALRRRLGEVLGQEEAMMLMGKFARDDFATKTDLADMSERFDLKLENLEHRLTGTFHKELSALGMSFSAQMATQTRTYIFSMVGTMLAVGSVVVAAA